MASLGSNSSSVAHQLQDPGQTLYLPDLVLSCEMES